MKKLLTVFIILLTVFNVFASVNLNINYRLYYPRLANVFSYRANFLTGESFKFGLTASLGYSFAKFTENGSQALIYGPSFSLGPVVSFPLVKDLPEKIRLALSVCASGNYAHFPVIFRGEAAIEGTYRLTEKLFTGLSFSYMFPDIKTFNFNLTDTKFSSGLVFGVSL